MDLFLYWPVQLICGYKSQILLCPWHTIDSSQKDVWKLFYNAANCGFKIQTCSLQCTNKKSMKQVQINLKLNRFWKWQSHWRFQLGCKWQLIKMNVRNLVSRGVKSNFPCEQNYSQLQTLIKSLLSRPVKVWLLPSCFKRGTPLS